MLYYGLLWGYFGETLALLSGLVTMLCVALKFTDPDIR